MKGEVTLNVVTEPMDHFTTFDDNYLSSLLSENKKGSGYNTVVLKEGMENVVE